MSKVNLLKKTKNAKERCGKNQNKIIYILCIVQHNNLAVLYTFKIRTITNVQYSSADHTVQFICIPVFKRELHNLMCLHFFLGVVFRVLHTFEKSTHIIASFNLLMIVISE